MRGNLERAAARCRDKTKKNPELVEFGVLAGGSDRRRSGDLSIFSRTLYQLSYRAGHHRYR
jgi:hypothetical protein